MGLKRGKPTDIIEFISKNTGQDQLVYIIYMQYCDKSY